MWRFSENFAIFSDRQNFGRRDIIRRINFGLIWTIVASSIHFVLEKLLLWWSDNEHSITYWMRTLWNWKSRTGPPIRKTKMKKPMYDFVSKVKTWFYRSRLKLWISFVFQTIQNWMKKNTLIFCDVRNVTVFVQFRHIFGPSKFRSSQISTL